MEGLTDPTRMPYSWDKKTLVDHLRDKILSEFKEAIDQGNQEGVYQKVNTTRSAIMFWATLNGLIQFKKMKTTLLQGESHKALYTFAVEQFIRGLMIDRPLCQQ